MAPPEPAPLPIVIDSDNAMGSPFGDVDDAFAIATLLKLGLPIEVLATVFGNTFEPLAYRNHLALSRLCGFSGKCLRGAATWWSGETEASRYLAAIDHPVRVLAIGPLTNIARALSRAPELSNRIRELVFVGTNYSVHLPAFRFFDFNQWKDPRAIRTVLQSGIPLVCIPCDVARHLRLEESQLETLPGDLGEYLRRHSRRWFRRARLLKWSRSVPIWDLAAAMYLSTPELFQTIQTTIALGPLGQARFGLGGTPIRVVTAFDARRVQETAWRALGGEAQAGRPLPLNL